jgi:hypothetical protein
MKQQKKWRCLETCICNAVYNQHMKVLTGHINTIPTTVHNPENNITYKVFHLSVAKIWLRTKSPLSAGRRRKKQAPLIQHGTFF